MGIALIVLGVVLMAVGIFPFLWPLCGVGVVLLIVGVILVAVHPSQPMYYAPQPPYGYPPQAPAAPPAPGAPTAPGAYTPPGCPVCGTPLTWVAQYGRWYCTRCQAYR